MEATRLENFEELLDEFKKLPDRVERPPTFMEIAGYPHYENVCSNILAFFMDPEGPHRLGTLVLDALANAANIATDKGFDSNISVEREVTTETGNRIDILVESDAQAILVENKIYAGANNPFDDYADYLDHRASDGHVKHKLLLTVFPTNEGKKWDFTNLTHEKFVEHIRSLLGRYVSSVDARYLTIFLDFLNTLENLKKGSRMDQQFVTLLAKRSGEVTELLKDLESFRSELQNKVQDLQNLIDTSQYPSVEKKGLWRGPPLKTLSNNLYFQIRVAEDLLVGIDTNISPRGWEIQIFPRGGGDPSKLKALLENLEIPFEETWRFIHTSHFTYNAKLDQISPVLQDVVGRLAKAQEHQK